MIIHKNKTIEELKELQFCRLINGFVLCNFVIRNGVAVASNLIGKNMKFPSSRRFKKKRDEYDDPVQKLLKNRKAVEPTKERLLSVTN